MTETPVQMSAPGVITHTEWRITDASGQAIGLHRYRSRNTPAVARLLYLPGTNMNGTLKPGTADHNLWTYLAVRGIEVFALDYRTRFVPHDTGGDLSMMRDWTMDLYIADALGAVELIKSQGEALPLFIAGFSRGVSYAYALAGQSEFAGLVALDGSFKSLPYQPYDLGGALRQFDLDENYAVPLSRRGYERRAQMMQDVIDDPTGPAADPDYGSAAEQLSEVLYRAWGPGVLANTRQNITDIQLLAAEMLGYDWYFPAIQRIEGRSLRSQLDDPRSSLDDHFGELSLPILYMGTGGMGPDALIAGVHSASHSGSKDVTIHLLEEYGHLDVLFAQDAPRQVFQVVARWINARAVSDSQSEESGSSDSP